MKEMIEKLNRARRQYMNNEDYGDGMVDALTDSVLAVMERIDAMEQPPKVREPAYTGPPYTGLTTGDEIVNSAKLRDAKAMEQRGQQWEARTPEPQAIERAAMIKALRWADRWLTGDDGGVVDGCPCGLCSAITRLENGGDL